jgi:hypothetical protein
VLESFDHVIRNARCRLLAALNNLYERL